MCRTPREPARSCRGSTFWVQTKRSSPRNAPRRASAWCAGFGPPVRPAAAAPSRTATPATGPSGTRRAWRRPRGGAAPRARRRRGRADSALRADARAGEHEHAGAAPEGDGREGAARRDAGERDHPRNGVPARPVAQARGISSGGRGRACASCRAQARSPNSTSTSRGDTSRLAQRGGRGHHSADDPLPRVAPGSAFRPSPPARHPVLCHRRGHQRGERNPHLPRRRRALEQHRLEDVATRRVPEGPVAGVAVYSERRCRPHRWPRTRRTTRWRASARSSARTSSSAPRTSTPCTSGPARAASCTCTASSSAPAAPDATGLPSPTIGPTGRPATLPVRGAAPAGRGVVRRDPERMDEIGAAVRQHRPVRHGRSSGAVCYPAAGLVSHVRNFPARRTAGRPDRLPGPRASGERPFLRRVPLERRASSCPTCSSWRTEPGSVG